MWRISFIALLLLCSCQAKSQKIVYQFPQKVTEEITGYISNQKTENDKFILVLMLTPSQDQKFTISIFENKVDSSDLVYNVLIKNTNRFVNIDNNFIPIITSEDIQFADFGTVNYPNEKTGKRRTGKKKVMMNIDGFTITFDNNGTIFKE